MANTYIAFLRGINVGGHNVKMERLRELFTELGLQNVRSYINSGNIFFETGNTDRQELTRTLEQHLREGLGYEVPVYLRTTDEVEAILTQDPFKAIELTEDTRFCVVFTNESLNTKLQLPVHSHKNDMDLIAVNPHEAFVVWHIINGRPPSGKFPTDVLPMPNTARFYHTLGEIYQAATKTAS